MILNKGEYFLTILKYEAFEISEENQFPIKIIIT